VSILFKPSSGESSQLGFDSVQTKLRRIVSGREQLKIAFDSLHYQIRTGLLERSSNSGFIVEGFIVKGFYGIAKIILVFVFSYRHFDWLVRSLCSLTLNERTELSVGELLSTIGRLQTEQQKQVREFKVCVYAYLG
ncbi:hypothetical protein MIMGU_mgv11b019432mg, partial [Erythranthe guttata]